GSVDYLGRWNINPSGTGIDTTDVDASAVINARDTDALALVISAVSGQAADLVQIRSNGASDGNLVTVTNSGNVGIATTTPSDNLTVVGTSTVWGTLKINHAPIRSAGVYDPGNSQYQSLMLGDYAGSGVTSTSK